VILRNAPNVHEFLQRVFVGYVVSVPSDNVKWRMVLLAGKQPSSKFIDNLPGRLVNIEARNRRLEIASICKAMGTEGAKVG